MTAASRPVALTIAGSDSGGGAGIQADLKVFHHFGVYGTSAITLVTAQNTVGVQRIELLAPDLVVAQIEAVAGDFAVAAAKTGALGSAAIVAAVAEAVARHGLAKFVVDPVMISKHGHALLDSGAVAALREALLPRAALLTPNLPEAAALVGGEVASEADVEAAARALHALGAAAVLVKGGHGDGAEVADLLLRRTRPVSGCAPRVRSRGTPTEPAAPTPRRSPRGSPSATTSPPPCDRRTHSSRGRSRRRPASGGVRDRSITGPRSAGAQAGAAARSTSSVISDGAPRRIGGPQKPVPRLT